MNLKVISLVVASIAVSGTTLAQKTNETSAAVERQNAIKSVYKQDLEGAKKSLLKAQEYIDLAINHEDTKNSQKTLWLYGEIYTSLVSLGMKTQDMELIQSLGESAMDDSYEALKKGYPLGKKYKSDIKETVQNVQRDMSMLGGMMYEAKQYAVAAQSYESQAKFATAINEIDTVAMYNSAISYNNAKDYEKAAEKFIELVNLGKEEINSAVSASQALRELEKYEEALAIVEQVREKYPSDKSLITEIVNTNLATGNNAEAEKALTDAIAADPNNKLLHFVIGSIYMDLKKNSDAEESFKKALEIDPKYLDVQYQLGAHLYNWANELKLEANNLDKGDPNEETLLALSSEKMDGAIKYLEMYLESSPNEKAIIEILYRAYHKAGNSEKAAEYKKRLDSL